MHSNHNEPILPIPADLYDEIGEVQDRVNELRRDIVRLNRRYAELDRSAESLAVDSFGEPTTPAQASAETQAWLWQAEAHLEQTENRLRKAHVPASRLKLTDAAAELREQQLADHDHDARPRRGIERTR